jgi:hypothetical protein
LGQYAAINWRGGRAVECGSLENYFRVKLNGGSNPPLSVTYSKLSSMEEIIELKQSIISHDWETSLAIIEELEEMGRQDKINNLQSFLVILLIHLIKIHVENRVTTSWRNSIVNSLLEIQKRNQLGKKAHYIKQTDWEDSFQQALPRALIKASQEAFGGIDLDELTNLIDRQVLKDRTFELLDETYRSDPLQIFNLVKNLEVL